jgi:hypothetical protein
MEAGFLPNICRCRRWEERLDADAFVSEFVLQ